jgi:hypothetical protein
MPDLFEVRIAPRDQRHDTLIMLWPTIDLGNLIPKLNRHGVYHLPTCEQYGSFLPRGAFIFTDSGPHFEITALSVEKVHR